MSDPLKWQFIKGNNITQLPWAQGTLDKGLRETVTNTYEHRRTPTNTDEHRRTPTDTDELLRTPTNTDKRVQRIRRVRRLHGASYLISLSQIVLENIALVRSFSHIFHCQCQCQCQCRCQSHCQWQTVLAVDSRCHHIWYPWVRSF